MSVPQVKIPFEQQELAFAYWRRVINCLRETALSVIPDAQVRVEHGDDGIYSVSIRKKNGWWSSRIIPRVIRAANHPDPVIRMTAFMGLAGKSAPTTVQMAFDFVRAFAEEHKANER